MSTISPSQFPAVQPAPAIPMEHIFRLTVEQYHDMIRAGILTEDEPIELLEGWLVYKMPKRPPHSVVTGLIAVALARLLPPGWHIRSQEPVTFEDSEPEPDVAVVRGERRQYNDHHPSAVDVAQLVETADTTLKTDRGIKKRTYARAAIAVYWIVNIPDSKIEAYTDPTGPAEDPDYRQCHEYSASDAVPVVINGREVGRINVADLLP